MYRKMAEKGLAAQYKESVALRNFFRYLVVLAFVRTEEITVTLRDIVVNKWPIGFDENDPCLIDF